MSPNNNQNNNQNNDTDVYLQNTAAAILTLQTMHLNNSLHNSPNPSHPASPRGGGGRGGGGVRQVTSPLNSLSPQAYNYNIIEECQNKMNRIQQLHKRNLSLDGSERDRTRTRYGKNHSAQLGRVQQRADPQQQQHTRHHSYEGAQGIKYRGGGGIDQTMEMQQQQVARQHQQSHLKGHGAPQSSPIRRSSSFSTKPGGPSAIKKSASSTSFKKYHYEDERDIYINDDDDLDPAMSNDSEYSYELDREQQQKGSDPITNTRCNKAFLMRMEQNKGKPVPQQVTQVKQQGNVACPNTPEMSRRGPLMMRQPLRDRQSMPRDSSLNRMKQDLSANLSSTKKGLKEVVVGKTQTQTQTQVTQVTVKVQPKYLDISKYKPTTTGNFLKKDESKSYLVKSSSAAPAAAASSNTGGLEGIKRSPSSASVTLTRTDPTRMSNRSVKSAGMRPSQKKEPIGEGGGN